MWIHQCPVEDHTQEQLGSKKALKEKNKQETGYFYRNYLAFEVPLNHYMVVGRNKNTIELGNNELMIQSFVPRQGNFYLGNSYRLVLVKYLYFIHDLHGKVDWYALWFRKWAIKATITVVWRIEISSLDLRIYVYKLISKVCLDCYHIVLTVIFKMTASIAFVIEMNNFILKWPTRYEQDVLSITCSINQIKCHLNKKHSKLYKKLSHWCPSLFNILKCQSYNCLAKAQSADLFLNLLFCFIGLYDFF